MKYQKLLNTLRDSHTTHKLYALNPSCWLVWPMSQMLDNAAPDNYFPTWVNVHSLHAMGIADYLSYSGCAETKGAHPITLSAPMFLNGLTQEYVIFGNVTTYFDGERLTHYTREQLAP